MQRLRNRGQVGPAVTIAGMAVVLYIVMVVIGQFSTLGSQTLAGSTAALASFNNVSQYAILGVVFGSIGLLVYVGMSLLGMLGSRR